MRVLPLFVGGFLCLIPAGLRHEFFWGEGYHVLLHVLEGLALVLFTVLAGLAYVKAARLELKVPTILKLGTVLLFLAVVAPPFLSSDVFDYVARGRVESVHGQNPYLVPPSAFADPLMQRAQWAEHTMVYGPILALVQSAITWMGGDHLWPCVYGFKVFFAACHLLTAWLVYLALRQQGGPASLGLLLYLLNPWILLECAGSGHNDALMAVFLAAMAWLLTRGQMAWATLAFGLAVLTKHGCIVIGPLLLVLAIRQQRLKAFGLGVLATALVTVLLATRYFPTLKALGSLGTQITHQGTSLQYFLALVLGQGMTPYLLAMGVVVVVIFLVSKAPDVRDLPSFGRRSSHLVLLFLLVGLSLFSPWYHLWWLPLAGLWLWGCARSFVHLAFCGPLSYLVYATTRSYELDHQLWQWGLALVVPIVLLVRGDDELHAQP